MVTSNPSDYAPPSGTEVPPAQGIPVNPGTFQVQAQVPGPWSTGLFDCTDDVGNCCITFWCPCITFGQIADIVDRGSPSCRASGVLYAIIAFVTGCQCIYSWVYRSKIRAQYSLQESPCNDFLVHCCCEACALCQAHRELKNRGFDMTIGWHLNIERQQGQTMTILPPIPQGGMTR